MDSFSSIYKNKAAFYRCFGVAPKPCSTETKDRPQSKVQHWLPVVLFIGLYWTAHILCLIYRVVDTDVISTLSNHIQRTMNGLACSVVLAGVVFHRDSFYGMLNQFDYIDNILRSFGHQVDYRKLSRNFMMGMASFIIITILVDTYELLAYSVTESVVSFVHFLSHIIPCFIYGLCMQQSIFIIYCILNRCRAINRLLHPSRWDKKRPLASGETVVFQVSVSSAPRDKEDVLKNAYQLAEGLYELCQKVNAFFGISFLASLMAIFAVTSIQSFYIYKVASDFNPELNRTVSTLFLCINQVVVNIVLVTTLAYVSEQVTSQVAKINARVRKLEDEQGIQCSSWLNHVMLSNIKISAFGFFNVNCTMLGGFVSGWITYLLILVQCNAISGVGDNTKEAKVLGVSSESQGLPTPRTPMAMGAPPPNPMGMGAPPPMLMGAVPPPPPNMMIG